MDGERIDTSGVEPEPEGAETPAVWPAAVGVILGAFAIAVGIIQSTPWLWILGIVGILVGLAAGPMLARLPRDRKGRRKSA